MKPFQFSSERKYPLRTAVMAMLLMLGFVSLAAATLGVAPAPISSKNLTVGLTDELTVQVPLA
jgi:hypothetical protein